MKAWLLRLSILALPLLVSVSGHGSPQTFNLGTYAAPQELNRGSKPLVCTFAYLVEDYVANETYVARMQFAPAPDAVVRNGRMPCPIMMPPRVSEAALNACRDHANKPADCVFADMSRGFESAPLIVNTSENASRCESDQASDIGLACWNSGKFDVCNVGCGATASDAILAARKRCEAKHLKTCTITGAVPVEAP